MPSGVGEYALLLLTIFSAAAQVGLNAVTSIIIGTEFRSRAPWAFLLVISLACAWAASLLHFTVSYIRLVRFVNKHQIDLKRSGSALVLPLGAKSLAAALGSAFLSGAVVWIAKTAGESSTGGELPSYTLMHCRWKESGIGKPSESSQSKSHPYCTTAVPLVLVVSSGLTLL